MSRRRRKKCKCDKDVPSSMPCGVCIKKIKRTQKREKEQQFRAKQERNRLAMTAVSSITKKPLYVVVGTTVNTLFATDSQQMLADLKGWLDNGHITDLVILVPFHFSSRHAKKHIYRILEQRGAAWAIAHLVFQWPHEGSDGFVCRASNAYEVTHFFDISLEPLSTLAHSSKNLQQLFRYRPAFDGWMAVKAWLSKCCPEYIPVLERAEEAGVIITTGP